MRANGLRIEFRAWGSVLLLAGLVVLPSVVSLDANRIDLDAMLAGPSRSHLLGTDENGRDVLDRLLVGAQATLGIGIAGAAIAVGLGAVLGGLAGLRGGMIDIALMRLVDYFMAMPTLFVILILATLMPSGVGTLVLLIGLTGWMPVARLVRGQVRGLYRESWVEAARATGVGDGRLLFRHLLPNTQQVIGVAALVQLSRATLTEATISFLGLGVQPPSPTWGNMLIGAQDYLLSAPWLAIVPGVAITITLLVVASLQSVVASPRIGNRARRR